MPIPVSQQYPELLHYTTLAGLTGILSSGCLWATDANCLNDSSEITHFFDERLSDLVVAEARKYAFELARVPENLARMVSYGGIDKTVEDTVGCWVSKLRLVTLSMNRPFVLSLSGANETRVQESGLLSQWRAYGNDGGYALVLDTKALEKMLALEADSHHYMHVQIGDIFYNGIDPENQPATADVAEYEAIVRQGVSRLLRGGTAEETGRFYEAITALSCLCKHWGFWEEHEVRVVAVPASDEVAIAGAPNAPPQKQVKSLVRGETPLAYVELFAHCNSQDPRGKLPIKRIIVGPHRNSAAHEVHVKELLVRNGYALNAVRSKIPYIGK
jgi:hypothetical protein